MPRVKRGVTARARHKKVLEQAKGFPAIGGRIDRIARLPEFPGQDQELRGLVLDEQQAERG